MELSEHCKWWTPETQIETLPGQREWLVSLDGAGFRAFTGPSCLIGAKTDKRCILVIHRGRGQFWEISFLQGSKELSSCQVTSLEVAKNAGINWLSGASIGDILDYLSPHLVLRGGN